MNNHLIDIIKDAAKQSYERILEIRRDLHKHPELSFQEINTSQRVKNFLKQEGIDFTEGWAGYGIVASIKGLNPGPYMMLRADMDALPIQEQNETPYKSVHNGVMHACGHDVHTSSLLGAASILNKLKNHLNGEVKFVFQPGEEKLPGGASLMIKEGLFQPNEPDFILGQHVYPSLQAGHVGFRQGLYMASADEIYIEIIGKGGHAATPHLCIDPIVIASRLIIGLQELISRQVDPMTPAVLSFGKFNSDGGATNVIPDVVRLEGTLRAMDEQWRLKAHKWIQHFVDHTCKASGATSITRIETGYPNLKNDEHITSMCREASIEYLGVDRVHDLPQRMSSEDFAFYTQEVPGTFYRLGTGWQDSSKNYPVHSNKFDIDETALETGMGLMAYLALAQSSKL
ncbi:MAG TPA: M20 family metallopeptidase [Saprospiraceae bacterium]|nr:M20 family metallopeptidase [Saprospiraceae bacterium]